MGNVYRPKDGDRILWIRFSSFGDVLEAAASAYAFKRKFPNIHLAFLTKPMYGDVLKDQPYIDELLLWNARPWSFPKLICKIHGKYKIVIGQHRAGAAAFTALFSGAQRKFGYNRLLQCVYDATHWEYLDAIDVDFNSRPVPAIFVTEPDLAEARALLSGLPVPDDRKIFAIIGASMPQKLWPTAHWIELVKKLTGEGWGIVLNGHGPQERAIARSICEAIGDESGKLVLNLVDRANFRQMGAIAKCCAAALGNDTGPMHLAMLVGTPTLGFFGMTDARKINFRSPWAREVRVTCPDAGCWDYNCPKDCLADITPERALDAFHSMAADLKI